MVQSYIERNDRAGLSEYIEIYKTELPPDIIEIYCRNQVINALICYYASQARRHKIRFEAQADYPEQCPVPVTEVTVILGNLLENAVEACLREKNGKCSIRLRIFRKNSSLVFLTDNTCSGTVPFDADGKHPFPPSGKGWESAYPPSGKLRTGMEEIHYLNKKPVCFMPPYGCRSRKRRIISQP